MKLTRKSHLPLLLLSATMVACSTTPRVDTQTAPGVNIATYNTFGYVSPLGTDRAGYTSFLSSNLKKSTRAALEAKGYRYSENDPSMLVNFNISVKQKTNLNNYGGPPIAYGPWGYRAGLYGGWAGYGYPNSLQQYDEGTLMVDLVDPDRKAMIWEGVTRTRSNDASRWTDEQVSTHVRAVFEGLPAAGR